MFRDLASVVHSGYVALQLDFLPPYIHTHRPVTAHYGEGSAVHI